LWYRKFTADPKPPKPLVRTGPACPLFPEDHLHDADVAPPWLDSLDHWNSGEIIFVRRNDYMDSSVTRRKMRFLSAAGERVPVTYAFPIRKRFFEAWKEIHGEEYYVAEPRAFITPLNRREVNSFVAADYERDNLGIFGMFSRAIETDTPPILYGWDPENHAARIKLRTSQCWCGCDREDGNFYLDFEFPYEVVLSDQPLVEVIGEDIC
jgi:hypothetical protein